MDHIKAYQLMDSRALRHRHHRRASRSNQIGKRATCSPYLTQREVFNTIMSSSVQYSAFTRLLTHNNRVHDMEEMLRKMWVPSDWATADADNGDSWIPNPFAELQDDLDRRGPGVPGELLGGIAGAAGG